MSRDRVPGGPQSATAGTPDAAGDTRGQVPTHAIRVAFEDAVEGLEQAVAARDYFAANYWVARARLHRLAASSHLRVGAAPSHDDQGEVDRLRALDARFSATEPLAPDGTEPSMTAMGAWLARTGARDAAVPDEPASQVPPVASPLRRENQRSSGISYGDVMDVAIGPLGSWMLEHERKSADPLHHAVADTLYDLTHDAPYLGGFALGTTAGTAKALRDFVNGVPDAARFLAEVQKTLLVQGPAGLFDKAVGAVDQLVAAAPKLALWFAERWNTPDGYARGRFRGEAAGYGVTMLALAIASAYAGPLAELAGQWAFVIRAIEAVDIASDLTSVLRPLGLGARIASDVTDGAHTLGRAAHRADSLGDLIADAHRVDGPAAGAGTAAPGAPSRVASLEGELPADLRDRVPVVENADLHGASVRVFYRDGSVRLEVGPDAQPRHVGHRVDTIRLALRYQGPLGYLRRLLDSLLSKLRLTPGFGTKGFEARAEVQKLLAIQAELEGTQARLGQRVNTLSSGDLAGVDASDLERELADVQEQLELHQQSVDSYEPGRGFIAADELKDVVVTKREVQTMIEEDPSNVFIRFVAESSDGQAHRLGHARISLDDDGNPATAPRFYVDNEMSHGRVLIVDEAGQHVSLTGHALDQAIAFFHKRWGTGPDALPGILWSKEPREFSARVRPVSSRRSRPDCRGPGGHP